MEYSRKDIEELAKKSCFLKDNLEKVLRLSELLDLIFSSPIGENLALKGGTAINFAYFNLPRLSIDIDLDYIQLSREKMMKDRGIIKKSLREMVEIEGYSISDKSKEHFALDSLIPPDSLFFFQYTFSYLFPLPNVQKNTQANIDLY